MVVDDGLVVDRRVVTVSAAAYDAAMVEALGQNLVTGIKGGWQRGADGGNQQDQDGDVALVQHCVNL